MHTNSIRTEYEQENEPGCFNTVYQHSTYGQSYKKQMSHSSSNILLRIEQNIREYNEQIKKNKDVINQLQCQRKFFQKLSQKQKSKIDQIDVQKLRLKYQNKIVKIKNQTSQLHEVISCYQQEELQGQQSFSQAYLKIIKNKQFLMQTLIQLQKENQTYTSLIIEEQKQLKRMEEQITQNEKIIMQKQASYRKYVQLQIQIQKYEKINNSPKKRS